MSFTDARAAIVAAMDVVPGLTATEYRPKTLKAGAVFPLLDQAEAGPGHAVLGLWRVIVVLGGDERVAQQQMDENLPAWFDALRDAAWPDRARATTLNTSGGDLYAVEIQARSE